MRVVVLFSLLLTGVFAASPQSSRIYIQDGIPVKMRDGVVLTADVYRPRAEGTFPVLLERTPYNRASDAPAAAEMATHGYVVIVQDTRGRYDSGGEFYPFRYESLDGYDTVEWAAALPYSNGKVGMFGGSYLGAIQLLAAVASPPHLEAILPHMTASEFYDGWTYQSGALMQWFVSSWSTYLAIDTLRERTAGTIDPAGWVEQLPVERYPLLEIPPVSTLAPYFRDWVAHERDDEYWRPWKISDHYSNMRVKALHIGGWHDIFLKGTLNNFLGMQRSATAGTGQRLIVGPQAHAETLPGGRVGDVLFGKSAMLDVTDITLRWFDYALRGVQNEYSSGGPVRIFVMGENVWRDEQEFPPARARCVTYYLHRGALSTNSPGDEPPESYTYDPENPVPTIGGRLCCGNDQLPPGPFDQRPNETRSDVLVFSTPPLEKDLEVTGFIGARIFAESTGIDTDFTALLADVDPSGYSRYLTDGIVRARYRNSTAKPEPIVPGRVYEYKIDLWATSNVFKAGHRIRLDVSSSNFPRFNRNLNTGQPILGSTRMVKVRQKIYHDSKHPSAVDLPVVPR
ncbi:MAG TPA: CocE/NonD family hydrolase [Acidobacteriota bacterium]|nr:CocE/NonD family hydrolase [Acidobacteriota bacterium]